MGRAEGRGRDELREQWGGDVLSVMVNFEHRVSSAAGEVAVCSERKEAVRVRFIL